MEIKTKYNIGDEVCLILANRVAWKRIFAIDIRITRDYGVSIKYTFMEHNIPDNGTSYIEVDESRCFPTKEELLKSL